MDQMQVLFLGTGAAIPSPQRSLPSLALLFDGEVVLCDCCEGTQMRLQQAGISAARINHIFISHLHGDHIFGLPGLITSQHLLKRSEPLYVYGPAALATFLQTVQEVTQHHLSYPLIIKKWPLSEGESLALPRFSVTALPLEHSQPCYGFRFTEPDRPGAFDAERAQALAIPATAVRTALIQGQSISIDGQWISPEQVVGPLRKGRSIAYCTDTRPCSNAVVLAQEADVLIHESTFHPKHAELARETGHSTCIEAAEVARQAGCRRLFLYHISGRLQKNEEAEMLQMARAIFPATDLPEELLRCSIEHRQGV